MKYPALTALVQIPLLALTWLMSPCWAGEIQSDLLVSTEWLEAHLEDDSVVILHVAKEEETYLEGHIPGALFAKWDDFVVKRDEIPNELPEPEAIEDWVRGFGITDNSRIVLYDEDKGMSAARAFFTLDSVGLGNQAALLDGQFQAWVSEERAVSTEAVQVQPSNWNSQERTGSPRITQAEVSEILSGGGKKGDPKFLDARSEEYFKGTKKSGAAARAGHLPDAIQMDWIEALEGGDLPYLKDPSDLGELLNSKGVDSEDPVITYCNTGRSASHLYFTLRYLGFNTQMYDGSMSEWTLDEAHPVEVDNATE